MAEISLEKITKSEVRNLTGHERGLAAREDFKLEDLDVSMDPVHVIVPDNLDAISTSFFQGMFAASVKRLGGKTGFLDHYHFHAKPHQMLQIERGIDAVQTRRKAALG